MRVMCTDVLYYCIVVLFCQSDCGVDRVYVKLWASYLR